MKCMCNDWIEVAFFSAKDENGNYIQDLKYVNEDDACFDIRTDKDVIIAPHSHKVISTGLYVALPKGYELQIRPRSGLSARTDLIFKNTIGTIDAGYRNEICIMWYNLGEKSYNFSKLERIAQGKVEKVLPVRFKQLETLEELKQIGNDRGGGLGHSGKF